MPKRSLLGTALVCLVSLCAAEAPAAEQPYFITLLRLQLKRSTGEWVDIVSPDRKVDLMSAVPAISFFNNGRVPPAEYDNFRVTFDDHGTERVITRRTNYDRTVTVRRGDFIRVEFVLTFEWDATGRPVRPNGVRELRLTVDDDIHIDDGRTLEI